MTTRETRPASGTLADRVRYLRETAALRYCESDRLAGVHKGFTRLVEVGGRTNPHVEKLRKLATLYGVSYEWLSLGTGEAPSKREIRRSVTAQRYAAMDGGAEAQT